MSGYQAIRKIEKSVKDMSSNNPTFEKLLSKIKLAWIRIPTSYLLLISFIFTQIITATPIKLFIHKEFFQPQTYMSNNNGMLKLIPPEASVAAQNSLAAHLGKRDQISILPYVNNAEYIAVDLHPNQDQFNFNGLTYESMKEILIKQQKNAYVEIYHQGDSYLLKKTSK